METKVFKILFFLIGILKLYEVARSAGLRLWQFWHISTIGMCILEVLGRCRGEGRGGGRGCGGRAIVAAGRVKAVELQPRSVQAACLPDGFELAEEKSHRRKSCKLEHTLYINRKN